MNARNEKFGTSFHIDPESRIDTRRENNVPEYVAFSRAIRERLVELVDSEGWPECPKNIENVEALFSFAHDVVSTKWIQVTEASLGEKYNKWLNDLPDNDEHKEVRKLLSRPEELEKHLRMRQFAVLESLRSSLPDAWKTLLLVSSERQLAGLVLLRHWTKEFSDKDFENMGTQRAEFELFLDIAGIFGKYIDHAFVKQIELADEPGGSSQTPHGEKQGADRLYDIYASPEGDTVDLKPYSDVFPFDWHQLVKRLHALSDKVEALLEEKKLPETYQRLPAYFKEVASAYGSSEVDFKKLDEMWSRLEKSVQELWADDCPIMIIPQGTASVAGDANKIDVELRLGFRTEKTKNMEKTFAEFCEVAGRINQQFNDKLDEPYEIPSVMLNVQPFAFGPNLYWTTRGYSSKEAILSHTNAVTDVALERELPYVSNFLPRESLDLERYKEAAVAVTVCHEIGHTVMSEEDDAVKERIGESAEANILEELKAEAVGIKLFHESLKQNSSFDSKASFHFLAELGTLCDYALNKSSDKGSSGERDY